MVKTKKRLVCPECGKELKNARSVAGHMWFAHGKRVGEKQGLHDKIDKLESEPKITDDIAEKIEDVREFVHTVNEELLSLLGDVVEQLKQIRGRLDKLEPMNPGNPDKTEKKNPPGQKKKRWFLTDWLFGEDKSDDKKKSEKPDDDKNSWFL